MSPFVAIGEVADINPVIPKELTNTPNKAVTFLPMAAISESGRIIAPEERLISEVIKGYRYFEQGDVLLAKITPCMENGKAAFVENILHKVGFGSTEFHVLRPSSKIDGRYLFYMVWNPIFRSNAGQNMTGTAGQRRVPADFVKRYNIPLPPLEEQRRIAAILDKASAIRSKRFEAIRLTEELLRAVFLDMFGDPVTNPKGWEVKPMHKVIEKIEAGWSANGEEQPCKEDEWGVLKISAVTFGRFQPHENKVVKNIPPNKSLIIPKKGDLLFGRANTRELVAATCLVEKNYERLFLPDKLWRLIPNSKFANTEYLRFLLSEPKYRALLARKATGTSGSMLNVSQQKLLEMDAPIPHLNKQNNFAEVVWKIFGIRERLEVACNESNYIFNSLLHRAFRGEL
jgi:type I restriction enzyme, S subunit